MNNTNLAVLKLFVIVCLFAGSTHLLFAEAVSTSAFDSAAPPPATDLMNDLVNNYDPCAGSPAPAVCRCALEFPPVTYDTKVDFVLNTNSEGQYDLATGRTLMNLVRAVAVASAPAAPAKGEPVIKLYANPPATPDAMGKLQKVVKSNPNFRDAKLVKTMMLPRDFGSAPDRLFGGLWWLDKEQMLVVIYRGTQTPFEWYLDLQGGSYRKISDSFNVANGFGAAYQFCQGDLLEAIETYKPKNVFIGGHSLGGAVAGMTALDLHQRSKAAGHPYQVHAITFGQPRTFEPKAADLANAAIKSGELELWRVVNMPDPVPAVPPAAVGAKSAKFKHTRWLVMYDDDVSAESGRSVAWNHHYYYDGYFKPDAIGMAHWPAD
ncbi:MAG: lipase family protein [Phycisphaerales bacterium]|nr:lipase family protein [Phycisphaerales bacterium]